MPYQCKFCARPDIAEIFAELKKGIPRTSVCSKYGVDDYVGLGKCFQDHRPHDHAFEVEEAIKRNKKMLEAELKKTPADRMLIRDLEQRLASLRSEQRELIKLAKLENPRTESGETPLTIEAMDRLIAHGMAESENYGPARKVDYILSTQMTGPVRNAICEEILQLLATRGFIVDAKGKVKSATYIPPMRRETLPARTN